MASQAAALLATAAAGMFQGISAYHLFGHPVPAYSQSNQDAGELQREWLRVFQGSLRTVAPLSPLITASSAAAAYLNFQAGLPLVAAAFGVAALAQLAEGLYSVLVVRPLDLALAERAGKPVAGPKEEEEALGLLRRWGRLHAPRVVLSGVALGGCLWGLKLMLGVGH